MLSPDKVSSEIEKILDCGMSSDEPLRLPD